jgi:phosphate-selective porin OprO and OprP
MAAFWIRGPPEVTHTFAIRTAITAALMVACATPAYANDAEALRTQVEALRVALAEQQAQIEAQAKLLKEQQAQLEALTKALGDSKLVTQEAPKVALANNRLTVTSPDARSTLAVRANVQLDSAIYGEAAEGALTSDYRRGSAGAAPNREINGARDFSEGFYFRRARFGIEGALSRDFNYRLLLELGGSGTEGPTRINDAWVSYTGFGPLTLQLGAFSPPANMDDGTSPEDIPFLERSAAGEISRSLGGADGRIGFGLRYNKPRFMSAFTLTTRTVNDTETFDSQLSAVARAGGLVATGANYNLHLGGSSTYVFSPADQGSSATGARHAIRFRDRPEIRVDSTRLIDTGVIDAEQVLSYGAEAGGNFKNFYLQAEHFWFDVERHSPSALEDPSFSGWYLQGSWVLTGEPRRYNAATGSFQNPRPRVPFSSAGGHGAWELAARYSRMNLDYEPGLAGSAALPGSVRGGDQSILTLGVNWFVNPNLKLMFNYLDISVDRLNPAGPGNLAPFGTGASTPPLGVEIGQDLDVYALRTQYSF